MEASIALQLVVTVAIVIGTGIALVNYVTNRLDKRDERLNKRIDTLDQHIRERFTDTNSKVKDGFDNVNRRFDDLVEILKKDR